MVTVVTAFYEIPSKFSKETYWNWFHNFAKIPCNLMVFTSPGLVHKVSEQRKTLASKTCIISVPFNQLFHYQFIDKYKKQHVKDYYKDHSPELYVIWAEKIKFIHRAIDINHFKTNKFIWCDFGAFRDNTFDYSKWPRPEKIVSGKMNMLLLQGFSEADHVPDSHKIKGQPYGTSKNRGRNPRSR
jgi:hypothetical protein